MSVPKVYRHLTLEQAQVLDSPSASQAGILEQLWHGATALDPPAAPGDLDTLAAQGLIAPGGYRGWLGPHRAWGLRAAGKNERKPQKTGRFRHFVRTL